MLDLADETKARILQASTSEVYGDPIVHPQKESYWGNVNPIGIRSCYDEGKRVAETLMMDYHRQHNVDIRIIRIFNTYGPRMAQNDGRVVSNFIIQALKNEDITHINNPKIPIKYVKEKGLLVYPYDTNKPIDPDSINIK